MPASKTPAKSSPRTQSERVDLSSSPAPEEPKELGKAQAADAKQPQPPGTSKSPRDRRPESTKGKSHGEAQSDAGWVDLTPSSNKQRLAKAGAKQPQPPGTSKSPPDRKPESVSGLSLDDALKVTVPTNLQASAKYVRDMRAVIVTTDKKSFKLARRIGVVVKAHRDATPHANTKGVDQSWEDRCKTTFGFTARSSQNYIALLAIPEDTIIAGGHRTRLTKPFQPMSVSMEVGQNPDETRIRFGLHRF